VTLKTQDKQENINKRNEKKVEGKRSKHSWNKKVLKAGII
jgi:hypothetical protein